MSNDAYKCKLVQLITDFIISDEFDVNRPIFVTKDDKCILKNNGLITEVESLRCNHLEADPRLALHAVIASKQNPNKSIAVVSDDTDVFIILLSIASEMHGILYFRQGKTTIGKGIEYHNVTSLASHLGKECCDVLPGFHALTGSDFTYPFFRRSKSTAFGMMMNMNGNRKRGTTHHLLKSLGTNDVDNNDIIDFIIHTVYNRPEKEKTPANARMATIKVGKKGKYRSTNLVLPDISSLLMKIKRSNLVTYDWKNCLNTLHRPLVPSDNGWREVDGELVTIWFEGDQLPSDDEYDKHIKKLLSDSIDKTIDNEELNVMINSDSDSDSDTDSEYPISDENSDLENEDLVE